MTEEHIPACFVSVLKTTNRILLHKHFEWLSVLTQKYVNSQHSEHEVLNDILHISECHIGDAAKVLNFWH